jgi:predicted nucleotidyltransferase
VHIATFIHHEKFSKVKAKYQSFPKKVFDDAIELHENNFALIKNTLNSNPKNEIDFYYLEGSIVVLEKTLL